MATLFQLAPYAPKGPKMRQASVRFLNNLFVDVDDFIVSKFLTPEWESLSPRDQYEALVFYCDHHNRNDAYLNIEMLKKIFAKIKFTDALIKLILLPAPSKSKKYQLLAELYFTSDHLSLPDDIMDTILGTPNVRWKLRQLYKQKAEENEAALYARTSLGLFA
jgi:hypothetical protein